MTNKEVARILQETATLVELTGGNPFRARAFRSAARTLDRHEERVEDLLARGALTEIRGIGDVLAAQIRELVQRGTFPLHEELLDALPPGLLDVLQVKGLGVKKVRQLWQELHVTSLADLEEAAHAGRLATLDGFGVKTQAQVLASLDHLKAYRARRYSASAYPEAAALLDRLRRTAGVARAELCGALRRCLETVDGIDLVVIATSADALLAALDAHPIRERTMDPDGDPPVLRGVLSDGFPVRVYLAPPEQFGTVWWRLTGSEAHVAAFEQAYGVRRHAEEAALYTSAGLAVVPPELREGDEALEAAAQGTLPDLITVEALHGALHNHSTYSDGAHTLREMAEAARRLGLSYFGISDHSRSLQIANGLSIERVRAQQREIRALNKTFSEAGRAPFRIFSGIESDVLADGSLDYPDVVLDAFDFVVASVHTGLDMTEAAATERVLRAVEHPYTTILGHPTGRLLLAREGYPLDHRRVIEACAAHGVAIELNANPQRLDLDWRWVREATRQGVLIAINPDAHAVDQLDYLRWGVAVARKGWLTAEQCLNAKPLHAFAAWLEERRHRRERQVRSVESDE